MTDFPIGTRVVVPGGIAGTVIRISAQRRKWPILVKRDDGQERSYAASELAPAPAEKMVLQHGKAMP